MPRGLVTRIEKFSAAHRLHAPLLSERENEELYGKCNNPFGHGHNYTVEVTVEGEISPITGMIVNISTLKELIWEAVLGRLDHSNLDKQHEFFQTNPSTMENVAVYIWRELVEPVRGMGTGVRLHSIRVHETDKNVCEYRGD